MTTRYKPTRRALLAGAAAFPILTMLKWPASAAEFELKYATGQDPSHPVNLRAQEALTRIREATSGRVDIKLFPANQLGSDTDLLTQVRSEIAKTPIFTVSKIWDNGFRHVTSSTREIRGPADLKGFKLRVPPAPPLTSLFKALDAAPTPINFNEVYTSLQTKVVEGQENPLAIIATTRLYEVQKTCSLTAHVWDGYWVLGNKRAFAKLPNDVQAIITRELDKSAGDQRADIAKLSDTLKADLKAKGITFIDVQQDDFRKALASTNFYAEWKQKYGPTAWDLMEKVSGKLG